MTRHFTFLLLLVVFRAHAADPAPATPLPHTVVLTIGLVRLPQSQAAQFHLPVAEPNSKGIRKIFSREEYQKLLPQLRETGKAEILPMPRLVAGDTKLTSVELIKVLPYPTQYEIDPFTQVHIPANIETRDLGITVAIQPTIQSKKTAHLSISTTLNELIGYQTPGGKVVKVATRSPSDWLATLTRWWMPAGVASEPLTDSSRGGIDSPLDSDQILLVHGFSDTAKRITFFSIGLEILP